ncbi:MAG: tRNA uridine-5-carboxymethylaminomethyl(34) synthesis GTPase MnmE [Thermodesulfobacteriota bacterium]
MLAPAALEDTIAAIATPPGGGGIGIVRISGDGSRSILTRLFRSSAGTAALESHRLQHGWIADPETGRHFDEVLAVYMQAPRSYTREDVVEIHCHGNTLLLQRILDLCYAAGARPAAAGEFTRRAFVNGRIDLTRAEAVIELLQARTGKAVELAVATLAGGLAGRVENIRAVLVGMLAVLEVAIDFPEEDVEIVDTAAMAAELDRQVIAPLRRLIAASEGGRLIRDGIAAVILGPPNVGKSSLLNALLREERAIVTEIPGTTRDTIEECLDVRGMPVRIVDTAGIRAGAEPVEEMGIRRARQKAETADLVLLVVDASRPLAAEETALVDSVAGRPLIVVLNKIDLIPAEVVTDLRQRFGDLPTAAVSARTGAGLAELEERIYNAVCGAPLESEAPCMPNIRQRDSLRRTLAACLDAAAGLGQGLSADLLAVDLQLALSHLGDIVGRTTTDDVLDLVFSRFCIGK